MTNYLLGEIDIFADLESSQLALIENICEERTYRSGQLIFEENSVSQEFYIILDGEVKIQVDPDTIGDGSNTHEPTTIATLRWGQSFGEVALVDPGVRSASARCGFEPCKLWVIDRNAFEKLLESDYKMGYVIMRNLAADLALKIRQTNLMVRESLLYKKN